ncbi:succinate dehydrogenase, cytochrome b556 subunit [Rhizomicrobium palustre]
MVTSITHRITGVALSVGTILLAWWLIAAANGPDSYQTFVDTASSPLGQIVLFGFSWALAFHTLNGIRHLAWDMGYGFKVPTANKTGILVIVLSLVLTIAAFVVVWTGHGGYYQ